jgi:hypothetical protein
VRAPESTEFPESYETVVSPGSGDDGYLRVSSRTVGPFIERYAGGNRGALLQPRPRRPDPRRFELAHPDASQWVFDGHQPLDQTVVGDDCVLVDVVAVFQPEAQIVFERPELEP